MQSNITVANDKITGTLHYVTDYTGFSGDPAEQNGNFLALNLSSNNFTGLTSVKVGLFPSYGTGLVELIEDPQKNGVFKITNKLQKFKIVSSDGLHTKYQTFDLSELVLESAVG